MEFIVSGSSPLCRPWVHGVDLPDSVQSIVTDSWEREAAALVASEVLYNLSGRLWRGSGCPATIEFDMRVCLPLPTLLSAPAWALDRATNRLVGSAWERLRLPDFPVTEVLKVTTPTATIEPERYRLLNARELQLVDGSDWPATVTVKYLFGANPPPGALRAAAILAGEFALATAGSSQCRLPKRVTTITRQGVGMTTVLDSLDLFDKGRTGVPEVDSWIGSVNPFRARSRPRVYSPDIDPDHDVVDRPGLTSPEVQRVQLTYVAGARFDPVFRYRQKDGTPISTAGKHGVWQLADSDGVVVEELSSAVVDSGLTLSAPGTFTLVRLGDVTGAWPQLGDWEFQLVSDSDPDDVTPLAGGSLIRTEQNVPG